MGSGFLSLAEVWPRSSQWWMDGNGNGPLGRREGPHPQKFVGFCALERVVALIGVGGAAVAGQVGKVVAGGAILRLGVLASQLVPGTVSKSPFKQTGTEDNTGNRIRNSRILVFGLQFHIMIPRSHETGHE